MSKPNTSATGGIMLPHPQTPTLVTAPPNLTLTQFIQTLLVGLSNLPAPLVRPDWQVEPPKNPDLPVNWIAFGIVGNEPDANAYQSIDENEVVTLQRQETLEIQISVYGPEALDNISLVRDGLQIPQNSAALRRANMGYVNIEKAHHIPDLINERWVDRWVTKIFLHRYIQRIYPIVTFLSASGITYSNVAGANYQQGWQTEGE